MFIYTFTVCISPAFKDDNDNNVFEEVDQIDDQFTADSSKDILNMMHLNFRNEPLHWREDLGWLENLNDYTFIT